MDAIGPDGRFGIEYFREDIGNNRVLETFRMNAAELLSSAEYNIQSRYDKARELSVQILNELVENALEIAQKAEDILEKSDNGSLRKLEQAIKMQEGEIDENKLDEMIKQFLGDEKAGNDEPEPEAEAPKKCKKQGGRINKRSKRSKRKR